MRSVLTAARTAITAPRVKVRNTPYSLFYPGTAGNYADLGSDNLFVSTQPFAFEAYLNMESYFDTSTGVQGILSFKTDKGVPFVFFLQNVAGVIIKFGGNTQYPSMAATGANGPLVLSAVNKGWHSICLVFDGVDYTATSSYKFYIDGIPYTMGATSVPSATSNLNTIGRLGATFPGKFYMARLRVWTGGTAMSAAQVKSLYFDDEIPVGPTFERNFPHTDGASTTITETIRNKNGTITGASVTWSSSLVPYKQRANITVARTIAG